jgi:hypothetical protein
MMAKPRERTKRKKFIQKALDEQEECTRYNPLASAPHWFVMNSKPKASTTRPKFVQPEQREYRRAFGKVKQLDFFKKISVPTCGYRQKYKAPE